MATPHCNEEHPSPDVGGLEVSDVRAVRAQSGGWTLIFTVAGEVLLADGRRLPVCREVRLGGLRQIGRRPKAS